MYAPFKEGLSFWKNLEIFNSSKAPFKVFSVNLYAIGVGEKRVVLIFLV